MSFGVTADCKHVQGVSVKDNHRRFDFLDSREEEIKNIPVLHTEVGITDNHSILVGLLINSRLTEEQDIE
jgi:predicted nucleic acid-binding Zn finger protein